MESLYFVMTWLCHRTCVHCYEDRFRPYHGEGLARVVEQSKANAPRIIDALPQRISYDGGKPGKIILAGGEILLEAVRESVLYPGIRQIRARDPQVRVHIQTTGDLLTLKIAAELKALGVAVISISGLDSFHAGMENMKGKCAAILEEAGFDPATFSFFGATEDVWIGKLWPRGRAMKNCLSKATIADNFCNQWSGGLNFLEHEAQGSEVSIDPEGNVYPCCIKTKLPIGNLLENDLLTILKSKRGDPVYEAISKGQPDRMGIEHGWSVERFHEKSTVLLEDGSTYRNLCVGCDAFHTEVLQSRPLVQLS